MTNQMNKSFLWAYDDHQGWNYTSYFSFFNDFLRPDEGMKYVEVVSVSLLCFISFVMNVSLIAFFLKSKELRNQQQNMYVISVLASSLLFLPFATLIGITRLSPSGWQFGDIVCKTTMYTFLGIAFIKIWLMTLISVDRYFKIVHLPDRHFGRKMSIILTVCAWALPGVTLAFMVYSNTESVDSVVQNNTVTICSAMFQYHPTIAYALVYFASVFILEYLLPAAIMTASYVTILKKIRKSSQAMMKHNPRQIMIGKSSHSTSVKQNSKERRTTIVLIAILVLFLLMWTPLFGLLAMLSLDQRLESYKLTSRYIVVQLCMLILNTIIEPILFAFTTGQARQKLSDLLRKIKPGTKVATATPSTMVTTSSANTQLTMVHSS